MRPPTKPIRASSRGLFKSFPKSFIDPRKDAVFSEKTASLRGSIKLFGNDLNSPLDDARIGLVGGRMDGPDQRRGIDPGSNEERRITETAIGSLARFVHGRPRNGFIILES